MILDSLILASFFSSKLSSHWFQKYLTILEIDNLWTTYVAIMRAPYLLKVKSVWQKKFRQNTLFGILNNSSVKMYLMGSWCVYKMAKDLSTYQIEIDCF